jgi:hypothetical protein
MVIMLMALFTNTYSSKARGIYPKIPIGIRLIICKIGYGRNRINLIIISLILHIKMYSHRKVN